MWPTRWSARDVRHIPGHEYPEEPPFVGLGAGPPTFVEVGEGFCAGGETESRPYETSDEVEDVRGGAIVAEGVLPAREQVVHKGYDGDLGALRHQPFFEAPQEVSHYRVPLKLLEKATA